MLSLISIFLSSSLPSKCQNPNKSFLFYTFIFTKRWWEVDGFLLLSPSLPLPKKPTLENFQIFFSGMVSLQKPQFTLACLCIRAVFVLKTGFYWSSFFFFCLFSVVIGIFWSITVFAITTVRFSILFHFQLFWLLGFDGNRWDVEIQLKNLFFSIFWKEYLSLEIIRLWDFYILRLSWGCCLGFVLRWLSISGWYLEGPTVDGKCAKVLSD